MLKISQLCVIFEQPLENMALWSTSQLAGARRNARQRGLPADLSMSEWLRTVDDFGGKCAYCGELAGTIDHFIAMHHGGGTTVDNCVPSCEMCNRSKGGMLPDQVQTISHEVIERVRTYLQYRKGPRSDMPTSSSTRKKEEQPMRQKDIYSQMSPASGGELFLYPSSSNVILQIRRQEGIAGDLDAASVRTAVSLTRAEAFRFALDLLQSISPSVKMMEKEQEQKFDSIGL